MNKTIDISLAGLLFHLEESAYYKLKNYLQHVRDSLKTEEDIDEIMNEVEARIAELLMQKQSYPNEVVSEKQIEDIINIIGKPEAFEDEESSIKNDFAVRKRLFRDPDHAMIGGVAAGFAHYLGIDITLMRLLFLILLFVTQGSFLLIYLLLWIIIPKAKTVTDKLKMKGEEVSLDNIVENVSNEQSVAKNSPIGENIEKVGAGLGDVVLKLLGLFLAFVSGVVLLALIISTLAISPLSDFSIVVNQEAAVFQNIGLPLMWLNILTLLLVGIPFALLFVLGLKLLFPHIKSLSKNILLILGTIWIISFVVLSVKTISGVSHKSYSTKVRKSTAFYMSQDTIVLKKKSDHVFSDKKNLMDDDIEIRFESSPDSLFYLKQIVRAEGIDKKEAVRAAESVDYSYQIDSLDGTIALSPEFFYPSEYAYSDYDLKLILLIPKNKAVKIQDLNELYIDEFDCEEGDILYNNHGEIYCSGENQKEITGKTKSGDKIEIKGEGVNISIDNQGLKIKAKDHDGENAEIEINEKGIKVKKNK